VRGRITTEPDRDRVAIEVRMSGSLFRASAGIGGAISQALMLAVLLLWPAGTLDWPRAWVFIAVWAVNIIVVCVVSSTDVLVERMWPLRDLHELTKGDRVFVVLLGPLVVTYLVVMPIEVFHLDLPEVPDGLAITGLVLLQVGWVLMTLSVRQNRFAAAVVKIQSDRGHEVIDSGVYGLVRHPMYLGASMLAIGLPLWLGSYLALALGLLGILGLAMRIRVEERVLRDGLPGYADYAQRVRHRLVPFVW
jgi:protein-S-isoprenylcysteine O-methyltransferase Ste14